jgi:hypothetical protein
MVARQNDDLRVKHAALRTELEVQGALSSTGVTQSERVSVARTIDALAQKMKSGMRIKHATQTTTVSQLSVEVDPPIIMQSVDGGADKSVGE